MRKGREGRGRSSGVRWRSYCETGKEKNHVVVKSAKRIVVRGPGVERGQKGKTNTGRAKRTGRNKGSVGQGEANFCKTSWPKGETEESTRKGGKNRKNWSIGLGTIKRRGRLMGRQSQD